MLQLILMMMSILLAVGFFTLLERKLLSMSQLRLGPNKNWLLGIIQPILDGLKLFKKKNILNIKIFRYLLFIFNFFMFFFSLLFWTCLPYYLWMNKSNILFWMILIFSLMSFSLLMIGWNSLNKYSFLGSIRSISQIISLEILMSLIIFIPFMIYSYVLIMSYKFLNYCLMSLFPLMIIIFFMEAQRSPLDLCEAESELVSGYNTEFSSIFFVLIFMSEYLILMSTSLLLIFIISKFNFMMLLVYMMSILLVRSCYPRIRFDMLMNFCWMKVLPLLMMMLLNYWIYKLK